MNIKVPFEVIGNSKSYSSNKPSLVVEDKKDVLVLTITKQFPTPGYTLSVEEIRKTAEGQYTIITSSKGPINEIQLQVITYVSTIVQVEKTYLDNNPTFIVKPSAVNPNKDKESM